MRRLLALLLFVTTLGLLAQGTAAASELRTYNLHNRSAAEMIPILRPMLDSDASISGTGYTLIVRSSPRNLDEIEQLIQQLDTALRNLVITVHRGLLSEQQRSGASLSGSVGNSSGRVTINSGDRSREGGSLSVDENGNHASVRVYRTDNMNDDSGDQRLRVLEGQWAQVQTGQQIPLPQRSVIQGPGGATVQESIEYKNVTSGFEVRPRVSGDNVTLDIRPFRNRPAVTGGGAIDTQNIITTVSGRLGEWIELGGVNEESRSSGSAVVHSTERREREVNNVYIKVDVAP